MIKRHVTRCLIAGFVALIPVGGLVFTILYLEQTIASSGLAKQVWYFPGLGLLAAFAALYVIGLVVTTVVGRWFWAKIDRLLRTLPAFGSLYSTLKQILGYGSGEGAMFHEVVVVRDPAKGSEQLGLVTERIGSGDTERVVVFVPGAPNPTAGELLLLEPARIAPTRIAVDEALKAIVSLGKTSLARES